MVRWRYVAVFSLLTLLGFLACVSSSRRVASGADAVELKTYEKTFPSGLLIVVDAVSTSPLAGVALVVGSGSATDPPGKEGLAHYVEHLVFRSRRAGGASYFEHLHSLNSVSWNGTTDHDSVGYHAFVAPADLPALLELIGGVMDDPLAGIDENTFAQERTVVINELRLREENGSPGEIINAIYKAAYPANHRYSRPVGGTHESLAKMTLADAQAFAKAHYRPENMTLVISGPIMPAELDGLVARWPERLRGSGSAVRKRAPVPQISEKPPQKPASGMHRLRSAVASPELWIAWTLPSVYGKEGAAVALAGLYSAITWGDALLQGHKDISSRSVALFPGIDSSLLLARVVLKDGKDPEGAARSAISQIRLAARRSASRLGIVRTKALVINEQVFNLEDPRVRTLALAEWTHLTGEPEALRAHLAALEEPSHLEVARYGFDYLKQASAHLVFVEPLPPNERPPEGKVGLGGRGEYEDRPAPNRRIDDITRSTKPPGASHAARSKLANGLELIVVKRTGSSFWSALLGFRQRTLESEPPGSIEALWRAPDRAVTDSSYVMHGLSLASHLSYDSAYELLRGRTDDLPQALRYLSDLRAPLPQQWPTPFFERRLPVEKAEQNTAEWKAERHFNLLMSAHESTNPTIDQIGAVTLDDLRHRVKTIHRPDNAVLIVVGAFELKQVEAAAKRWFGDWRVPEPTRKPLTIAPARALRVPKKDRIIVAHRPGATQTTVRVACILPPLSPEQEALADVLRYELGARTFHALRWSDGSAYNAGVELRSSRDGTLRLVLRTDVEHHRLTEVLRRILKVFHPEGTPPIDSDLVRLRAWDSARNYNARFITADDIARAVYDAWNRGWPLETIDTYPQKLAAVRAEHLTPLVESCRANTLMALVGDEPSIRVALRDLERAPTDAKPKKSGPLQDELEEPLSQDPLGTGVQ